ncbi:MAG: hypothetical protein LBN30_05310 [Oscillospiraceae bacterium]|jgi:hypothetical protein|nr:hypothetical protein [Oscillospiraceae bacterium]
MKRFSLLFALVAMVFTFSTAAYPEGEPLNSETELIITGELNVASINAPNGIIVERGAKLTVNGEVSAGDHFECRGGVIVIRGNLEADRVWLDSSAERLDMRVDGGVIAKYYTQSGGAVSVGGDMLLPVTDGYDGLGALNVSNEHARYGESTLDVTGGVFALGGTIIVGSGGVDEVCAAAFEAVRTSRSPEEYAVPVFAFDEPLLPTAEPALSISGKVVTAGTATVWSGTLNAPNLDKNNLRVISN